jgi:hypothetical protein
MFTTRLKTLKMRIARYLSYGDGGDERRRSSKRPTSPRREFPLGFYEKSTFSEKLEYRGDGGDEKTHR